MRITPISNITFTNSQPIRKEEDRKLKASDFVTVTTLDENGNKIEKRMSPEEYKMYEIEQKTKKEQKHKQEELKKQQDWIANINRPQTYHK